MTVSVLWLLLRPPWVGVQCVIVVFPGHTHLLFCLSKDIINSQSNYTDSTTPEDEIWLVMLYIDTLNMLLLDAIV